jgi:uncharacterized protein (DUF2147 family)
MRSKVFPAIALVLALGWAASVRAAQPTPPTPPPAEPNAAGLWEELDPRTHIGAWFFIFEKDGVYYGAMVKMFVPPGKNPNPICTACSGDQKNQPSIGLVMIKGMQRNGRLYENGTILDPRDGSVYNANMEVTQDGQKLKLRGYLGIPLFGQTQIWKRLPDDALAPNEVPANLVQYWPAAPTAKPDKKVKVVHPVPKPQG